MSTYETFIFESYAFDAEQKTLTLRYGIDDAYHFTETYTFDFDFAEYNPATLDRAVQLLFFMAGVSYYKTFLPKNIVVQQGEIDPELAEFLAKTWQKGLGEFFYTNRLDPRTTIDFPTNTDTIQSTTHLGSGKLVGLGGGKDSLVSIELLRGEPNLATWSVGHRAQLTPLVERSDLPHYWVSRVWDQQLLELNGAGAYNGHVPISAILACAGVVAAVLSGRQDVVVSNEQSANEPTLDYDGVAINHQYSKSQEFETDFQHILAHQFGDSIRYYSLLRPLSELRIAELFAKSGFEKYHDVFSSCNHAFTHDSDHMFWDETCPKCCFVYLALYPFVGAEKLGSVFRKNLLRESALQPTYRQLLGIEGDKPLECVGEIQECRAAMRMAQRDMDELRDTYAFELPDSYDYTQLWSHNMPDDVWQTIASKLVS
ncbi:hypothetical protein KDA14_02740 [Candidatus Saccharibacteria bacterium]|nr:hypothetical protein [Candidatus Saccharibacteria bacterium]